jgi:hypothetical protein
MGSTLVDFKSTTSDVRRSEAADSWGNRRAAVLMDVSPDYKTHRQNETINDAQRQEEFSGQKSRDRSDDQK